MAKCVLSRGEVVMMVPAHTHEVVVVHKQEIPDDYIFYLDPPILLHESILAHKIWLGYFFKIPAWKERWSYHAESLFFISQHDSSASVRAAAHALLTRFSIEKRPTGLEMPNIRKWMNIRQFRWHFKGQENGCCFRKCWLFEPRQESLFLAGEYEDDVCAICFEPMRGDWMFWDHCNHAFHHECVENLTHCPLCRQRSEASMVHF